MKKILEEVKKLCKINSRFQRKTIERKELEKKVVEGAQKALKEYGRAFERLAQYDRN